MRPQLSAIAVSEFGRYSVPLRGRGYRRAAARKDRMGLIDCARRLEKVLTVGNYLFSAVRRIERNWRNEVLTGQSSFDPQEEKSISEMLAQWLEPCEGCFIEIRRLRLKRIEVPGARQFERNYREAVNLQAGRNPFFDDVDAAGKWAAVTAKDRAPMRAVNVDSEGRIFELSGARFVMPGLSPADVLGGIAECEAGRTRSLDDVIAARERHGV